MRLQEGHARSFEGVTSPRHASSFSAATGEILPGHCVRWHHWYPYMGLGNEHRCFQNSIHRIEPVVLRYGSG
eukprot:1734778-Karenia_brevis.AAC.1